jgi:hypothetical protein
MSRASADVKTNSNGTVSIQYVPTQSGPHDVVITYNDHPVAGKLNLSVSRKLNAQCCYN